MGLRGLEPRSSRSYSSVTPRPTRWTRATCALPGELKSLRAGHLPGGAVNATQVFLPGDLRCRHQRPGAIVLLAHWTVVQKVYEYTTGDIIGTTRVRIGFRGPALGTERGLLDTNRRLSQDKESHTQKGTCSKPLKRTQCPNMKEVRGKKKNLWDFADSNHVPYDLQSYALPGELKSLPAGRLETDAVTSREGLPEIMHSRNLTIPVGYWIVVQITSWQWIVSSNFVA